MAVAIVFGVVAFASQVVRMSGMVRFVVVLSLLVAVALVVAATRHFHQTERGTTGPNPAVNAVLGAFLAGTAAGALVGWAWSGRWPDAPSIVMYLAMLGLGVVWLLPWLGRQPR